MQKSKASASFLYPSRNHDKRLNEGPEPGASFDQTQGDTP